MPKYALLRRVHLDAQGYIRRPAWNWGSYRGVGKDLYQLTYAPKGRDVLRTMEFRADNRADAVIQARKFLARENPSLDVRS